MGFGKLQKALRDHMAVHGAAGLRGFSWKSLPDPGGKSKASKNRFQKDPMALKSADDKSKRLVLLEELQRSPALDLSQKKWLREELMRIRKGIQGELESAHYFSGTESNVLLHDLRFVIDGGVTQIDHLILNRMGSVYLLETKNYACNLVINDRGEFTAEYENARFGIASPIEQSLRHEKVLRQLLERLDIVGRTQKHPDFHHVVMLHPKATIERPPAKSFDTANVIKADQFSHLAQAFYRQNRPGHAFQERTEHAQPGDDYGVGREAQEAAPSCRLAGAARLHAATRIDQSGSAGAVVVAASAQIQRACACPLAGYSAGTACRTDQTPGLRPM